MTVRLRLLEAQGQITAALGLAPTEARIEAQALLQAALKVDRAWLIVHAEEPLEKSGRAQFEALLGRRLAGEPVAYIVGTREFHGLTFNVSPATLIPRPDTETLVEAALERIPNGQPCQVLDLGTGSGAIAIAIAKARPLAHVVAAERSPEALQVARGNAKRLDTTNNVTFVLSDWFAELKGRSFDIIVSNPPYIPAHDAHLQQGDLRFEPLTALAAGEDGLDCIRRIITEAGDYLNSTGWLLLEHGYDQAAQVAELLRQSGYESVASVKDLAGIARVTLGQAALNPHGPAGDRCS